MDRITEITEAIFNALTQIQHGDTSALPMPELVHQQLCTYLDQCGRMGLKLGLPQADIDDIRFALVALTDEVIVNKSGTIRDFWLQRLLQMRYFDTGSAGDAFFDRLALLRGDRARADVLKVYYLCLMFGFRGKYRVRGGEVELLDIVDGIRNDLIGLKLMPNEIALSPSGARPYEPAADRRRNLLLIGLATAAAVGSVLLYIFLRLSLLNRAEQLAERLAALVGS
jgi:type VI secretion system protein ImpK